MKIAQPIPDKTVAGPADARRLNPFPALERGRFALLALAIALVFFVALDGWHRDFHVPLSFSNDALVFETLVKGTMDHGWWWTNPSLSAPYEFHALAFPANCNVDHLIVWLVSRFTGNIGSCVNFSWMAMLIAAGLCMAFCAEALGTSRQTSWIIGLLYAFCPYGLYRQIDHFSLAVYLIPFPATAALLAATNRVPLGRLRWVLVGGCAAVGLNYVYYAFFAVFFLALAAAVGYANYRSKAIVSFLVVCCSAIALSTALNLAPSYYVWAKEGTPRILRAKSPAESEVYGLKIRQLISPVFQSSVKPFRKWTEKEAAAQYPLETENMIDRLGFVATLGFLAILASSVLGWRTKSGDGSLVAVSGQFTVGGVLLATIGGFGSLFALLISPEIRAYNRITGFLTVFALVAVGVALDRLAKSLRNRYSWRAAGIAAGIVTAVFGVYDQTQSLQGLNRAHKQVAADFDNVEKYVSTLEARLPAGSSVFQLPFRTYLNDEGIGQMRPYDHSKVYLVSHHVHWSYPALSNEQVDFQDELTSLAIPDLLQRLKSRGFRAVLIDRYGYLDEGAEVAREFEHVLGGNTTVLAKDNRYVAYDLGRLQSSGPEDAAGRKLLPPMKLPVIDPVTSDMSACGGLPLYSIDSLGNATAPLAGKTPTVRIGAPLSVEGWAVDQATQRVAGSVELVVDGTKVYGTAYGRQRPDVAAYFKLPAYGPSGFSASIPTEALGGGTHRVALRVLSPDRKCYRQSPDTIVEVR